MIEDHMGLREKWAEQEQERQAANEKRARAREAERAKETYRNSPLGMAESAYQSGDQFFQVEMEVSSLAGSHSSTAPPRMYWSKHLPLLLPWGRSKRLAGISSTLVTSS